MFELRDVTTGYGEQRAIDGLSLRIDPGQTMVLVGPSGSGKSTVLKLLLGLAAPSHGEVLFEGAAVTPENARQLRRSAGYVVQGGGLFPHLTAGRNVTLMARQVHLPEAKLQARVAELCELTHFP